MKRYTNEKHVKKDCIADLFICPDCGFTFNAKHHLADEPGVWVCPFCENEELDVSLDRLDRIQELLEDAKVGAEISESLYLDLVAALLDNGPLDYPYDPEKMTPEQKKFAEGAVV